MLRYGIDGDLQVFFGLPGRIVSLLIRNEFICQSTILIHRVWAMEENLNSVAEYRLISEFINNFSADRKAWRSRAIVNNFDRR